MKCPNLGFFTLRYNDMVLTIPKTFYFFAYSGAGPSISYILYHFLSVGYCYCYHFILSKSLVLLIQVLDKLKQFALIDKLLTEFSSHIPNIDLNEI